MTPITVTPDFRRELVSYQTALRLWLATSKHVSGDDCEHCGLTEELADVTAILADGFYTPHEWEMVEHS